MGNIAGLDGNKMGGVDRLLILCPADLEGFFRRRLSELRRARL